MIWSVSGGTRSASNSPRDLVRGALGRAGARLISAAGSVALAPECLACRRPVLDDTLPSVCTTCWDALELLPALQCPACGRPQPLPSLCGTCLTRPRVLTRLHACGRYDGVLRTLIHEVKYGGRTALGARLGALARVHGADVLRGADGVVPVPLFPIRRLVRGFNQAALLAGPLGPPVVPALRRTRWTASQTTLTAAARRANVGGAFSARRRLADGRVLVLVDDVRTTGATLDACATVLLAAGAAEVRGLVLARADPPGPPARPPR